MASVAVSSPSPPYWGGTFGAEQAKLLHSLDDLLPISANLPPTNPDWAIVRSAPAFFHAEQSAAGGYQTPALE